MQVSETDGEAPLDILARGQLIEEIMVSGARNAIPGPNAARSQDFLYDQDGMPA